MFHLHRSLARLTSLGCLSLAFLGCASDSPSSSIGTAAPATPSELVLGSAVSSSSARLPSIGDAPLAPASAFPSSGSPATTPVVTSGGAGPAPSPSAAAVSSTTAAPADAPPIEGDKRTGAEYSAFLSGPRRVKAGSTVALTATFVATGRYHCNEKYPTSFKPDAAPAGVSFSSDKFTSASFSPKRSTVPVTLTASSPGAKTIAGTLKFGVCDESECIPVKAPVSFVLDVE